MNHKRNFESFIKRTGFERKPYQAECFAWCLKQECPDNINIGGGILALDSRAP
jgi:hypothetical protein